MIADGVSYSPSRFAMCACAVPESFRRMSISRSCSSCCSPVVRRKDLTATSLPLATCFAFKMVENAPAAIGPSDLKPNSVISLSTLLAAMPACLASGLAALAGAALAALTTGAGVILQLLSLSAPLFGVAPPRALAAAFAGVPCR